MSKFEKRIQNKEYDNPLPYSFVPEVRNAYNARELKLVSLFMTDLTVYLVEEQGVPEQYARKVASKAWEDGHANGYSEILNVAQGLAKIFQ